MVSLIAMHVQETDGLQSELFRSHSTISNLIILPEGTCCHRAAQYFLSKIVSAKQLINAVEVITVASFYKGKEKLEQIQGGECTLMLIPDISDANRLIMQTPGWNWDPNLSFPLPNPPLYFAKANTATVSGGSNRCATITGLQALLKNDPEFKQPENFEFYNVLTTQDAAIAAIKGEARYCITNEAGISKSKNRLQSVLQL